MKEFFKKVYEFIREVVLLPLLGIFIFSLLFSLPYTISLASKKEPQIICTACGNSFDEYELEKECETCNAELCYDCGVKAENKYEERIAVEYENGYADGFTDGGKMEDPYWDVWFEANDEGYSDGYDDGYYDGKNGEPNMLDELSGDE